ncbi:MAG: NADH-quinone oxidoreductase subunit J [Myxococcota bacterium]
MFSAEWVAFVFFGVMSLASAMGVVLVRNAVKGALSLIVCFFSLAALFVLQNAELLGALQVLVYAGAIMVLFVFVIMLVENKDEDGARTILGSRLSLPVKLAAVLAIAWGMSQAIARSDFGAPADLSEGFGSVRTVGLVFLRDFVLHFELSSLLLLVGIVGAVIVSKRGRTPSDEDAAL